MRSMLHFSRDLGLRICGKGIWYLGDAIVSRHACWILLDGGLFGWNGRCKITVLLSFVTLLVGPE